MDFATAQTQSKGKWHDILRSVGIDSKYLTGKHTPCPVCGGKDRFRFDNKNNQGGWICSACGAGDGFSLISRIKKISLVEAKNIVEPLLPKVEARPMREPISTDKARAKAKEYWNTTTLIGETDPVRSYLINRLGQHVDSDALRSAVSLHPADKDRTYWVMAAMVTDTNGNFVSVHRTFLLGNGEPAKHLTPSKMLMQGSIPPGSAIRLTKPASHLGIAEGIETSLAANIMTGIPTWSVISAPFMKSWEPPKGVRKLTIFSDNDATFTGQSAAYDLARRLALKGNIKVEVRIPAVTGQDWADVWKGKLSNA